MPVRAPADRLTSFDIKNGEIREEVLNGNILFIAAQRGRIDGVGDGVGIFAYDVADPAALNSSSIPLGYVQGEAQWMSIATDVHGRVYATGFTSLAGLVQSFRVEDFIDPQKQAPRRVIQRGGMFVSWTPGATFGMNLDSATIISDRPEAYPRKLKILLNDDEEVFDSAADFKTATGATSTPLGNGFESVTATFILPPDHPYAIQRITVENMTLDLRWSADALTNRAAVIPNIIARPNDRFRVLRNVFTYGVVSLFGFGIGVYDLNAMESNDSGQEPPNCEPPFCKPRELVRTTSGSLTSGERFAIHEDPNDPTSPLVGSINPCHLPNPNQTPAIPDLTLTADAGILTFGGSSALRVFALDPGRGILDLVVQPPSSETTGKAAADSYTCGRSPFGLVFRNRYQPPQSPPLTHDHPRLGKLRQAFMTLRSDPPPFGRFTGLVHYHWRLEAQDNKAIAPPQQKGEAAPGQRGSYAGQSVDRDYLLVAGNEYGLMVVEVGGTPPVNMPPWYTPLQDAHLVDIIWVPTGAYAVRHIPRTNLAVVVDREGHVILVDLSRLDERFKDDGTPRPEDELFPSVTKALSRPGTWGPPATAVGMPDPRIVWRSAEPYVEGTLPPVIDGDTGILYAGAMLKPTTKIGAVIDPRIQVKVDVGAPSALVEVGGIIPLGVDPPREFQIGGPNASLAAFRLELRLPGAVNESISGNRIRVAVESETVVGAAAPQTVEPFPPAHLRVKQRDGSSDPRPAPNFYLERTIPPTLAAQLRFQRGFNKFVSPWIVAIADPRATKDYQWPPGTNTHLKRMQGCSSCDRPAFLLNQQYFELWSAGRQFVIRPEIGVYSGPYAYLGARERLSRRIATVPADIVRPSDGATALDELAGRNLPTFGTEVEQVVALNTGEVVIGATDLTFKGRGLDFVLPRYYSSAITYAGPFGRNFDSPLFARVRRLPNGDIEFYDGTGRRDVFEDGSTAPSGVFLDLRQTKDGMVVAYPNNTLLHFDSLGRLSRISDRNMTKLDGSDGNAMNFIYNEAGLLGAVVDPVGRAVTFRYSDGLITSATDFDGRVVTYGYDSFRRLTTVKGPDPQSPHSTSPSTHTSGLRPPTPGRRVASMVRVN